MLFGFLSQCIIAAMPVTGLCVFLYIIFRKKLNALWLILVLLVVEAICGFIGFSFRNMPEYFNNLISSIVFSSPIMLPFIFSVIAIYTKRKKLLWFVILPQFVWLFTFYVNSIFNNWNFIGLFFNREGFSFFSFSFFVYYFWWSIICLIITFIVMILNKKGD